MSSATATVLLLVALIGATCATDACFDKCMIVMGCNTTTSESGDCGDVWENCCTVYDCNWAKNCQPKAFAKNAAKYQVKPFKIEHGVLDQENERVECKEDQGYYLNTPFTEENDFTLVDGHLRWKFNTATEKGVPFPAWPLCVEPGFVANVGGEGEQDTSPIWEMCKVVDCFDQDGNYADNDVCNGLHCDVLDKKGLRENTGDCCEVNGDNNDGETRCATSAISGVPMTSWCDLRGCGWSWHCSVAELGEATGRSTDYWMDQFMAKWNSGGGENLNALTQQYEKCRKENKTRACNKACKNCIESLYEAMVGSVDEQDLHEIVNMETDPTEFDTIKEFCADGNTQDEMEERDYCNQ